MHDIVTELGTKPTDRQKEIVEAGLQKIKQIRSSMPDRLDTYQLKFKQYLVDYIERELITAYE
jgi:hypothetical protein